MRYRYRTDEEMKDSGVEWIGKIPKEWDLKSLKFGIEDIIDNRGKTPPIEEIGIPLLEIDSLIGLNYNPSTDKISKFVSKETYDKFLRKYLKEGDILFATVGSIGRVAIVPKYFNYCIAQNIVGFRTNNKIYNKYLLYYMNSTQFKATMMQYNKGNIQDSIKISNLIQGKVIVPSIMNQEKIANFLDEKTSQFDLIISKKEELIKKLEEAKKSLISEVVTGKVKVVKTDDGYELIKRSSEYMKDSGVEWLGDIPKDWKAKRIKYLFNIKKDIAGKLGYDVLSVTQSGIKIKDITKNEGQLSMDYSKYQIVDIGNFVMNHMDLLTGFVDCSKFKGVTSPDYRVFRLIDNNNCKQYYNYIFQLCYHNRVFYGLAQGVSGMGRWRLQTDTFKNFIVPIPSYKEQEEIAIVLQDKLNDIERLKNRLNLNIQKLKEAKQSLISEAVTGKIEILD